MGAARPAFTALQVTIFLISAALLAYEILLVKLFTLQYWYHCAYLIISIALLGFGTSGTCLFFFKEKLTPNATSFLYIMPIVFAVSVWIDFYVICVLEFNPFLILWQMREMITIIFIAAFLFVPFLVGAMVVGLGFLVFPDHVHWVYSANLMGSGFGTVLTLLIVYHFSPYELVLIITLLAATAALPVAKDRLCALLVYVALAGLSVIYVLLSYNVSLDGSAYKELRQVLNSHNATKEYERFGPYGLVTVVDCPAYHFMPDMSLNCMFSLPDQKGLFLNGNMVGAITRYPDSLNDLALFECRTASVAYRLLSAPSVLIIGSGGGTEVLNALYHGAGHITAVEINRDIIGVMQRQYREYSGDIYHDDMCRLHVEDGRWFLAYTRDAFDLIRIAAAGSMNMSAGIQSLSESYLLTTETLSLALKRLRENGLLSISQWIENPPRGGLKLMAMAIDALRMGGKEAENSIMVIKSWQTVTILVKNGVFTDRDITAAKAFCRENLFDMGYYPGITETETNVYNQLDKSYFFQAAQNLLRGDVEQFYDRYPFDIHPATDDKPFFFHFFKFAVLKNYFKTGDRNYIPFLDWGYILVWISLLVLMSVSFILIIVPLTHGAAAGNGAAFTLVFFGTIGVAYMFLEMSFLQQFIRYLHDPVFAASVVVSSFLIYSGVGSFIGAKLGRGRPLPVIICFAIIVVTGVVYMRVDTVFARILSEFSLWKRMLVASALIAPLAVPMGVPFPSGLSVLHSNRTELIPWAWGINGFFSVVGTTAAILVAVEYGFRFVTLAAVILYCGACIAYGLFSLQRKGAQR